MGGEPGHARGTDQHRGREPRGGEGAHDPHAEEQRVPDRRLAVAAPVLREIRSRDGDHGEDARRDERERSGRDGQPEEGAVDHGRAGEIVQAGAIVQAGEIGRAGAIVMGTEIFSVCAGRQIRLVHAW